MTGQHHPRLIVTLKSVERCLLTFRGIRLSAYAIHDQMIDRLGGLDDRYDPSVVLDVLGEVFHLIPEERTWIYWDLSVAPPHDQGLDNLFTV